MKRITRLSDWYAELPEPMRTLLAVGSVGKLHMLDAAVNGLACAAQSPTLPVICADMVLASFGETPLSGELATQILNTPILAPQLDQNSRQILRTVSQSWSRPENLSYFQRVVERREMNKIKHFLEKRIQNEPNNLFWYEQAMSVGMYEADYDWLTAQIMTIHHSKFGPVLTALMGQINQARGLYVPAEKCIKATKNTFGKGWRILSRAEICLQSGDRQGGLALLLKALRHSPWQTQAALRAYDLLEGLDQHRAQLPGSIAVLLYSWNKCRDLNDTLASLHASDLGDARLFVLDNGSTDTTPEVLSSWQQRFGKDRMEIITLPVNAGAAGARNWLMHHPAVCASDWAIYLDDDAVVPEDWLTLFGAAVQHYPDAGVWGCKVVDAVQPALLQAVDYHLLPLAVAVPLDLSRLSPHPVSLSNLHIQVLDSGQFDYMRPCVSVTGCCHLFKTERLHECGDFSLYLSPSQYDDLERDLRMAAGGNFAVYQGHLRVLHRKRTGRATLVNPAQEANALGNKYKMQAMHEPQEIAASTQAEHQLLKADLQAKLARLDQERE
ncbi:MAG: glycosyltransferase family 2 protein [Proteobacteria bacterium]|nr:glycosyltransferase family 2 protein [Pseudomonadota bacterium]MBU1612238.1 glycosyltransferase family 2 protein [Pseudomonadota bacterium]